ncbi:hypothetical protein [Saccharothrix sp.]|uniref:hypothetical protein n=1 Tax=Saccharothrix sp. TaxID=1873460 RepID=UPI002811D207|nr:hypothetical protein [Saccharothrix sp.]
MIRTRAALFGALVGVALLGACGQAAQPGTAVPAAPEVVAPQAGANALAQESELATAVVPGLGTVLTDGDGLTLYRFDKDTASPSVSNCDGECAQKWPPAVAQGEEVKVAGVDDKLVDTIERADGTRQITVNGWPMYHFAQDSAPGDAKGQGVGGTWFVAAPDGKKAQQAATGLALTTASVGKLGTVLTDKDGMTLYRFDKDTAKPPTSNCDGDCAVKWPPLLVESENFEVQGVDKALVGTVTRKDGTKQVTVAGWPLYLFAEDKVCGEAKGHGVGGVWFAAEPDGSKA